MKITLKTCFLALFLTPGTGFLSGCSIIQNGGDPDKKDKKLSNTTFIYSYSNDNKPVESARVRDNGKINVQVKDSTTGELLDTRIDAGGWILVKPDSPIQRKSK